MAEGGDPLLAPGRSSSVAHVLQAARASLRGLEARDEGPGVSGPGAAPAGRPAASLREPSRPYTPLSDAASSRRLFAGAEYGSNRPTSAYNMPKSGHFRRADKPRVAKLRPLAPLGAGSTAAAQLEPLAPLPPGGSGRSGEARSFGSAVVKLEAEDAKRPTHHPEGPPQRRGYQRQRHARLTGPPSGPRPGSSRGNWDSARPKSSQGRPAATTPAGGAGGFDGGRPQSSRGRPGTSHAVDRPGTSHGAFNAERMELQESLEAAQASYEHQFQPPAGEDSAPWGGAGRADALADEGPVADVWRPDEARRGGEGGGYLTCSDHGEVLDVAGAHEEEIERGQEADPKFVRWKMETEKILLNLGGLDGNDFESLCKECDDLHTRVDRGMKDGQREWMQWLESPSTIYTDEAGGTITVKEAMIEHMGRLMDTDRTALLLKAGVVVLKLSVGGSHALVPCVQVLLRLSKESRNDVHFRRERVLMPLLSYLSAFAADGNTAGGFDVLVYAAGVLKNVSNEEQNQKALFRSGAVGIFTRALMRSCKASAETARPAAGQRSARPLPGSDADRYAQVCVQVTGVLRNLTDANLRKILDSPVVGALSLAMSVFQYHNELMLNVARILAKLSVDEAGCYGLSTDKAALRNLLKLLQLHQTDFALTVRVAFVLGNLTMLYENARTAIAFKLGGIEVLAMLLRSHTAGLPLSEGPSEGLEVGDGALCLGGAAGAPAETPAAAAAAAAAPSAPRARGGQGTTKQEVLVKLLRVVANLSIERDVGKQVSMNEDFAWALLKLLQNHDMHTEEEVVLNATAALTNITFYDIDENRALALARHFLPQVAKVLMCANTEAVIEAARACGNFSRRASCRADLARSRICEALCLLLSHGCREVVYSAAGALVNLMADPQESVRLVAYGGVAGLVEAVEQALGDEGGPAAGGRQDVRLISVCCQALFNLVSNYPAGAAPLFSAEEKGTLVQILERVGRAYAAGGVEDDAPRNLLWAVGGGPTLPEHLEELKAPS